MIPTHREKHRHKWHCAGVHTRTISELWRISEKIVIWACECGETKTVKVKKW